MTKSINNKADLTASLDDGFSGIFARRDAPNHAALGVAAGRITGVLPKGTFDEATENAASSIIQTIGDADHLVLLMLDGFGMNFVDTLPEDSFLKSSVATTMPALFPTSTGPNLMALATGRWPAEHGNIGWDVHIPRLRERIQPLTWLRTRDGKPLQEIGFAPQEMLLAPMIPFNQSKCYTHVTNDRIAESATTQMYGLSNVESFSYENDPISQVVDIIEQVLDRAESTSFTYIYWSEVDSAAHHYGVSHPTTVAAVRRATALVEYLATTLEGRAKLVATADHGHLDSPNDVWSVITPSDPINQMLTAVPAGEPRTIFFHTRPGMNDAFEDIFTEQFGDQFILLRGAQAIDLGILGDPAVISDEARARIGDFLAISKGKWCIYASDGEPAPYLQSMHGGITSAEAFVPLIII